MQTKIAFMLLALVTVITSKILSRPYTNPGETVGLAFAYEQVTSGVRSRLQCATICDQHSWCMALSWDNSTKTCHEFNRTLTPEVTPSLVHTSNNVVYREHDDYDYIAGMMIKFVSNVIMTMSSAQNHCVQEGGRLVVLDTVEKHQAIQEVIQKDSSLYGMILFVGGEKIDGTWTLTTGQALDSSIHVTNDAGSTCIAFYRSVLDDTWCDYTTHFICEK